MKYQQTNRFPAVAQRHHEQPRAPILSRGRVPHHRAFAIINLTLLAGSSFDYHAGFRRWVGSEFVDESLHALVAGGEAAGVHQILPDRHSIATPREPKLDRLPVWLAGAGGRTVSGRCGGFGQLRAKVGDHLVGRFCGRRIGADRFGRFGRLRVGYHLIGRFCRCAASLAWGAEADPGAAQVRGRRFPPHAGGPLDAPQRPSQPPQRNDLLFGFFAQDITHIVGGYRPRARVNVLNEGLSLAGFQVIMYGRFWVITEASPGPLPPATRATAPTPPSGRRPER